MRIKEFIADWLLVFWLLTSTAWAIRLDGGYAMPKNLAATALASKDQIADHNVSEIGEPTEKEKVAENNAVNVQTEFVSPVDLRTLPSLLWVGFSAKSGEECGYKVFQL